MIILGIETSCDETAAAVVNDGQWIRSNVVASQIPVHARFGGVVPEIASRQHILAISGVTQRALADAELALSDVDAIACTFGPGLSGPLLVGTNFAKGLVVACGSPFISVNHIEGHVLSVWLEVDEPPPLPMVSLVVSGGHTELLLVLAPAVYELLGRTRDDAVGEAFDKVARLLGLPYPGGPEIERAAEISETETNLTLPRAWLPGTLDFSFSGLKTAVARMVGPVSVGPRIPDGRGSVGAATVFGVAAAFQASVCEVLSTKLALAVEQTGARSASLVGGVANNKAIRRACAERLSVPLFVPEPGLSTDNAAMIAGAAFWHRRLAGLEDDVRPTWPVAERPVPVGAVSATP